MDYFVITLASVGKCVIMSWTGGTAMRNDIVIMKMLQDDMPQVQELYRELLEESCPLSTMLENYRHSTGRPDCFPVVAKKENTILGTATGFICTALDAPFMVVENVVVRKDCRGMGVGRKLLEYLDMFAMKNNCHYSLLVSSGFRKDAHRFYEAAGYTDDVRGFRKIY